MGYPVFGRQGRLGSQFLALKFDGVPHFWSIFGLIFYRLLIDFGGQLEAMLAIFSKQMEGQEYTILCSLLRRFF